MNRNLLLLTFCQGMFLTNNVTFIAINGLVGLALAPRGWMATLPVMGYVVGGALSAPLVAHIQRRLGRKRSFQLGLVVAALAAASCAWAAWAHHFWWLVGSTLCAGFYSANASLYRFAGPELAAPSYKEKAISWVLAGGIVGAFVGPNLASATRDLLAAKFVGSYLALIVAALLSFVALSFIRFPDHHAPAPGDASGRPLAEIVRQPTFVVAVMSGALGYGIMNLLMVATPLAMDFCSHPYAQAALVIQWHVVGMYAPGLFTGSLIKRFGVLKVIVAGAAIVATCIGVALSGTTVAHFLVALTLLGVGWNFMYTGGTTLLTETYRPEEKARAQGANDFAVFTTMGVSSISSGALVSVAGWERMNLLALPVLAVIVGGAIWLAWLRRAPRPVSPSG